jgi:hypothetical protein
MTSGRFRHLLVGGDDGLIGMVDITDMYRALLDADLFLLPAAGTPEQAGRTVSGEVTALPSSADPSVKSDDARRRAGGQPWFRPRRRRDALGDCEL